MEIVPSPSKRGVGTASDDSLFSDWLSSDGGNGSLQLRDVHGPAEIVAGPSAQRRDENGTVVPGNAGNVTPPLDHDQRRPSQWTATAKAAAEFTVAGGHAGRPMSAGDCEPNSDFSDVESYYNVESRHCVSSNSDNDDVDDFGASELQYLSIDDVTDGSCGVPDGPAAATDRSPGVVAAPSRADNRTGNAVDRGRDAIAGPRRANNRTSDAAYRSPVAAAGPRRADNRTGDSDSKPSVITRGLSAHAATARPNAVGTAAATAAPSQDEPFGRLWTASSNLLSVRKVVTYNKKQMEKHIHDAYMPCKKPKPPAAKPSNPAASRGARPPPGNKSSAYLKRQAERVEIARINDMMAKRLLNVKPAVSSFRE